MSSTNDGSVAVKVSQVPEYLHGSALFRNLTDGEWDEQIVIPCGCLKHSPHVTNREELKHLLNTLRFWCCDDILLPEVIEFLFLEHQIAAAVIADSFQLHFPILEVVLDIAKEGATSVSPVTRMKLRGLKAIALDFVPVLQHFAQQTESFADLVQTDLVEYAARVGSVNCLRFILQQRPLLHWIPDGPSIYSEAMRCNRTKGYFCLELLHSYGLPIPRKCFVESILRGYIEHVRLLSKHTTKVEEIITYENLTLAVQSKSLDVVLFFDSFECKPNWSRPDLKRLCIRHGCVDILRFLREKDPAWPRRPLAYALIGREISYEMILYLIENRCPDMTECTEDIVQLKMVNFLRAYLSQDGLLNATLVRYCAQSGALENLQYLHMINCPCDASAAEAAILANNMDCLYSLVRNGCPIDQRCYWAAINKDNPEALQLLMERDKNMEITSIFKRGLITGATRVVDYCVAHGIDVSVMSAAELCTFIRNSTIPPVTFVQRLINDNWLTCDMYAEVCAAASAAGHCGILEMLHSSFQVNAAVTTASHVFWDERTCAEAASFSRLDCLQFAREHGCPWGHDTFEIAATRGNQKIMKYLMENGCPSSRSLVTSYRKKLGRIFGKKSY